MKQKVKETLLKIPVIGQMAAVVLLPRELKRQQQLNESLEEQLRERNRAADERWQAATETFDAIGQQFRGMNERWEAAKETFDSLGEQLRGMNERWEGAKGTFDSLGQQIHDVNCRTEELAGELTEEKDRERFGGNLRRLLEDGPALSALRSRLSIHPAVWGPAERLRIDPEASLDACLFNTNSGSITVGRYSFAGPGVSLIAGNHDLRLADFPRRDLQQEEGCDILIGQGVWLCANCTVLGPCRIGDHAVIAAGAVVIPGTEVEAGCLYAGVPARKIRTIDMLSGAESIPEEIFSRFGGCLYTEGWYTAESIRDGENEATGHWMIREEAEILCKAGERTLRYRSPLREKENRTLRVSMGDWSEEWMPGASGEIRIPAEAFKGQKTGLLKLEINGLYAPENGDPRKLGLFVF
ncbi:MAG: acyltransferase [Clostridia bacterium]|nr:acyltransferase [Clostridia bacterium]